jgi:hypothetical protein
VIAAVIVTAWLANGRSTITTLEEQSAVLRQRLAARSSGIVDASAPSRPDAPAKSVDEKKPIDWKELSARVLEMRQTGGMGDMRAMIRFQQQIQAMTRDELANALDEIATLDLPQDAAEMLEQMLIGPLCQKDPEFALTRYLDRLHDERGGLSWQLSTAMMEWSVKDPAAATAWFDNQIAAGKFDSKSLDGRSQPRMQFEGSLIGTLLSSDPAAASARLHSLPEDQRQDVLQHYTGNALKDEDQLAYATLVREELPESEQLDTLASMASRRAWNDGFTETDEFLERIKATPAERAASVQQVAQQKISRIASNKKVTRENIETLREWATTQAPDAVDAMTGKSLAQAVRGENTLPFVEASAMALEYHEASGNDEVLVSFLDPGIGQQNKEEARALAEQISDPTRREAALKKLK